MGALAVVTVVLGVACVALLAVVLWLRHDRRAQTESLAASRFKAGDLETRLADSQRDLAKAEGEREASDQRGRLLDEGMARSAARTSAAEDRARDAVAELARARQREARAHDESTTLATRVAALEERLAAPGAAAPTGADPSTPGNPSTEVGAEPVADTLLRSLWDLELARVEREWRLDAGPLGDGAGAEPLVHDGRAFERALGMEVDRIHEEVGVAVELRPALPTPPEPATALVGLRLAQELLAVGARRLEGIELDLSAEGADLLLSLSGEGSEGDTEPLRGAPGVADAVCDLGGTLAVDHRDGRVHVEVRIPSGGRAG